MQPMNFRMFLIKGGWTPVLIPLIPDREYRSLTTNAVKCTSVLLFNRVTFAFDLHGDIESVSAFALNPGKGSNTMALLN